MILNLQDNDKDDSKQSRYRFNQSQIYGIQKKKDRFQSSISFE